MFIVTVFTVSHATGRDSVDGPVASEHAEGKSSENGSGEGGSQVIWSEEDEGGTGEGGSKESEESEGEEAGGKEREECEGDKNEEEGGTRVRRLMRVSMQSPGGKHVGARRSQLAWVADR